MSKPRSSSWIGEHSPSHLLDIACGSAGSSLAIASGTGCRLTGVDIGAAGIAVEKHRAAALGLGDSAEFVVAGL